MSQSPLPPAAPADQVNLDNVQGDVIMGMPKKKQEFIFFGIADPAKFKAALPSLKVASTRDVIKAREAIKNAPKGTLLPLPMINIAFSQKGLDALGIKDNLGDPVFSAGQLADARNLGDEGALPGGKFDPNWEQAFKTRIDGVLLVVGETWPTVNTAVDEATKTFGDSIRMIYSLKCSVRPGEEKGHEHFGWEDGISNPAVKGVGTTIPGQRVIPPGIILTGKAGDVVKRPAWATEGSFLAFRQLNQLVPEFHDFLDKNPIILPGLDRKQGSELLGARLVGRWKSGAPIQMSPLKDDPKLAQDSNRNNNFVFPQQTGEAGQTACPYAAHIRKTNPRNDLDAIAPKGVERASMTRAGIPFGPEVSFGESQDKLTEYDRGLAFVSYQSELKEGFQFVQKSWANNPGFPFGKNVTPGFDPLIGQANGASRTMLTTGGAKITLPRDFVVSRGGEYFFSPPISALKTVLAGRTG